MLRRRLRGERRISAADVAIAACLLVLGQAEVALHGVDGGSALAAHALWALVAACALLRRAHPLLFALVAIAASALRYRYGLTPSGGAVFAIVIPLALFGIGAYGHDAGRSALAAAALLLELAISAAIALSGYGPLAHGLAPDWLAQFSIYLAAAAGGIALRDRTEVLRAARARVAAVPSDVEAAEEALMEERTRIAREIHAVVSAAVLDLLGDVEAARAKVRSAPSHAREVLRGARASCRQALDEMRRMLSLLRGSGSPPRGPAAGAPSAPPERLPWGRLPEPVRTQGVPLLVLVAGLLEAFLSRSHPELYGGASLPLRLAGAAALAAAFLPRRRLPLLTALGVSGVIVVRAVVCEDYFSLNLALYLAAFAAGAYARSFTVALFCFAVLTATAVATPLLVGVALPFGAYAFAVITVGAAWATGLGGRRRLAEAAELRALAVEERRRSARAAARAVTVERLRIARELHDLVGHGLTSIVLQCAAAERLLRDRPDEAIAAIDAVESVGCEVEAELVDLLAALAGTDTAQAPPLARLPQLLARTEAAGTRIELQLDGDVDRLPAGLSGAAYRILQEGLTNARKHGADGRVLVRVEVAEESLSIVVENPVADDCGEQPTTGHGLVGISERVRIYSGRFRAGPTARGTWSVEATLPLSRPASPGGVSPTLTMPLS